MEHKFGFLACRYPVAGEHPWWGVVCHQLWPGLHGHGRLFGGYLRPGGSVHHRPVPALQGVSGFLWFLAIVCFLVAGNLSAANSTSSLAHVGGFICGMMPSLLFIPHLGHAVADAIGAALAIVGSLVLVPLLFSLAFSRVLPGLTC